MIELYIHTNIFHRISKPFLRSKFIFFVIFIHICHSCYLRLLQLHKCIIGFDHLDLSETGIAFAIFPLWPDELYQTVSIVADVFSHSWYSYLFPLLNIHRQFLSHSLNTGFSLIFSNLQLRVIWLPKKVMNSGHEPDVDKRENSDAKRN